MKAQFIELPAFERHRAEYLNDDAFRSLQALLMSDPEAGDVIRGTGGLRKLRFADGRRGKGKRGWASSDLLLVGRRDAVLAVHGYDKDASDNLSPQQCKALKALIKSELEDREQS